MCSGDHIVCSLARKTAQRLESGCWSHFFAVCKMKSVVFLSFYTIWFVHDQEYPAWKITFFFLATLSHLMKMLQTKTMLPPAELNTFITQRSRLIRDEKCMSRNTSESAFYYKFWSVSASPLYKMQNKLIKHNNTIRMIH